MNDETEHFSGSITLQLPVQLPPEYEAELIERMIALLTEQWCSEFPEFTDDLDFFDAHAVIE